MDGDYDYINNGRQSSTLHVESADGLHFGTKEVAVSCEDYPENYTCTSVTRRSGRRGKSTG
mgnify:FL=1